MQDLAWISLARVYYTAANKVNARDGEREVDGVLLGNAVDAWSQDRLRAANTGSTRCSRSRGRSSSRTSTRARSATSTRCSRRTSRTSYYPEALVLKAVVFFYNCQMKNATAMVQKFHERYDPVKTKLDELLHEVPRTTRRSSSS